MEQLNYNGITDWPRFPDGSFNSKSNVHIAFFSKDFCAKYQPNTALSREKYQPNTEKVFKSTLINTNQIMKKYSSLHWKYQPNTEKVFQPTSSYFAPILALLVSGEVALNCTYTFTGSISIKHVFRAHEITDWPRSSDFSCKSNWMFCKIKTAPRFSFLPSQRSGMLAVQLPQTLLHICYFAAGFQTKLYFA